MYRLTDYSEDYSRNYIHKMWMPIYNYSHHIFVDFCDELEESCKSLNVEFSEKGICEYIDKKLGEYNAPCIHESYFEDVHTGLIVNNKVYTNLSELLNYWIENLKEIIDEWHYKEKVWAYLKENKIDTHHLCFLQQEEIFKNNIKSLDEYEDFKKHKCVRFKSDPNYVPPKLSPSMISMSYNENQDGNGEITVHIKNYS